MKQQNEIWRNMSLNIFKVYISLIIKTATRQFSTTYIQVYDESNNAFCKPHNYSINYYYTILYKKLLKLLSALTLTVVKEGIIVPIL